VAETPCPHCGELHAASPAVCPKTGGALPVFEAAPVATTGVAEAAPVAAPGVAEAAPSDAAGLPDKGIADILADAWALYRKHARALLLTCAVLFVPASIAKSCALSIVMAPAAAAASAAAASAYQTTDLEASRRALEEAYAHHADAATIGKLQVEQARILEDLGRRSMLAAGAAMGSFTLFVLGLLGSLVTFFIYAVTVPLTNAALTIAVGDRFVGGEPGWRDVWMVVFRKLGPLLSAIVPAAFITAFGFAFFIVPGLILSLLFAFVSPVVLIEGLRGRAALQRSVALVRSDWLRVAIMVVVFGVTRWLAQLVAGALVPSSALFVGSLFGDLVTMLFLPMPVLGMVLLYFDIRRKHDAFTNERLRPVLDALRTA
jgi:hypothetical protein